MKNLKIAVIVGILGMGLFNGCSSHNEVKVPQNSFDGACHRDGEIVPKWVCNSGGEDFTYSAVGIGTSSEISLKYAQAMSSARSELAHQIQSSVKTKTENFLRGSGTGKDETIDSVTTYVTKQIANVNLNQSKKIKEYTTKKGNLYVLVTVPDNLVNSEVKSSLKSSFKNDTALWQQFQSKQSLDNLEKEFPSE